jgi:tRNA(adenine34) deaminase
MNAPEGNDLNVAPQPREIRGRRHSESGIYRTVERASRPSNLSFPGDSSGWRKTVRARRKIRHSRTKAVGQSNQAGRRAIQDDKGRSSDDRIDLIVIQRVGRNRMAKKNWVRGVKTVSTFPPKDLFTKDAETVARSLASKKVSPKGIGSGIRMLQYFINRAGEDLPGARRRELEKAKKLLQEKNATTKKKAAKANGAPSKRRPGKRKASRSTSRKND